MAIARTVVEAAGITSLIDASIVKYPKFEDLWDAMKWILSRDPTCGYQIDKSDYFLIKSDPNNSHYGAPSIRVLYKFSNDDVSILAIGII